MKVKMLQNEIRFNLNDGSGIMVFRKSKENDGVLDVTTKVADFMIYHKYAKDLKAEAKAEAEAEAKAKAKAEAKALKAKDN